MVGAFNAGADAVYLGGSKFGARAYADNFDRDQVLDAISYAHFHGKKIYMTVNTLIKQKEFGELYDFMLPYAEKRLDGVIVQDFGVMRFIRDEFPEIELHASTQQTVTGVYGAKLLKDLGCVRVVPARELSIQEMAAIRSEADIEVEAFIHGAMCYCYSGACLFSSMVGGRSGNRGRCAQPCRLPYEYRGSKGENYPLSLKDMNTLGIIPELIEAGIDSFKIEGRMKKPEYSAGVTALYRKYIDRYYADPSADFSVSKEDMETLKSLYQRTGISEGYYHKHNGKDMVTISSPAYNATSDEILREVHDRYLTSTLKKECRMECDLKVGEKAKLTLELVEGTASNGGDVSFGDEAISSGGAITGTTKSVADPLSITVYGNPVQAASKKPMDEASVLKQLSKLGNTNFKAKEISINIDDNGTGTGIFMPVSELNELRRSATEGLETLISHSMKKATESVRITAFEENIDRDYYREYHSERRSNGLCNLHVSVMTGEQLKATLAMLKQDPGNSSIGRIYVDSNLALSLDASEFEKTDSEYIVMLPYITRKEQFDGWEEIRRIIDCTISRDLDGVLVRNLEQLGLLRDMGYKGRIIADYSIYVWNSDALNFLLNCNRSEEGFRIDEITVPYELTFREACDMVKAAKEVADIDVSFNMYGHVPMMISAGCVKKTTDRCSGRTGELYSENISITDRLGNIMPVTCNCRSCYNVIWNVHPTSLHKKFKEVKDVGLFDNLRLDFTLESGERTRQVLQQYTDLNNDRSGAEVFENGSYTTGHYSREVE